MSAQTIVIILDIAFFVLLALGFLIGFWRGVKRSALEIAITIICIVIAGFLTPVVTNAILNISVGDGKTLNQYVIDIVMQEPNLATFVENSPSLAKRGQRSTGRKRVCPSRRFRRLFYTGGRFVKSPAGTSQIPPLKQHPQSGRHYRI